MSKRDASDMLPDDGPHIKKIKTEGLKPIVFTSPGLKTTDTRIVVFGQEFHVNSDSLKMLSVYFKKFMNPINVKSQDRKPVVQGSFGYEWFTALDEEGITPGGWFLSSDPQDRDSDLSGFKNDSALQEKCFHNLLRALFCRQSVAVADVAELCLLTGMAGYYLCLPAVSNSLYATLINNESLSRSIANDPCNALNCAYDLRNGTLFREALIYALGPWSFPRYEQLESRKLRHIAAFMKAKLEKKLFKVDAQLRLIQANKEVYGDNVSRYINSVLNICYLPGPNGEDGTIFYPQYYRRLNSNHTRERIPDNLLASIRRTLEPILKNNLRLDTAGVSSGIGNFKDGFLCFEVLDEELPWDREQLDWNKPSYVGEGIAQIHSTTGSWLFGNINKG